VTENARPIVSGVVHDSSGRPVAGARLFFSSGPEPVPDVALLTSSDGSFTLTAPTEGTYSITCVADDHPPATLTVKVGERGVTNLEIRLE
jgi:Carboxypeptidase regulatory-like domain